MNNLFKELRRRKVFRVAAVYIVVAWLMVQVADTITPALQLPVWTPSLVTVLLLLGFLPALIAAWAYEMTPDGLQIDAGVQAQQNINQSTDRKLIYAIFGLVLLVAGFQIADRFSVDTPTGATTSPQPVVNQGETQRVSLVLPAEEPMRFFWLAGRSLTIAPDGKTVAYVSANLNGVDSVLNIRKLDTLETNTLSGTEGASQPFFSPDGQWIGFFNTDGVLKKVSAGGGQAVTVVDEINGARWSFGTWLDSNQIVFDESGVLKIVSADGAQTSSLLTERKESSGETGHRFPEAIPGTDVVLFANYFRVENQFGVNIESLNATTGERQMILENAEFPKYIDSGHLIFRQNEVNLIAPFDPVRLEFTGPAVALMDEMRRDGANSEGSVSQFAVSRNGTLAYAPPVPTLRELFVVNRDGSNEPLGLRPELYTSLSVSPDGQYAAFDVNGGPEGETYLYNFSRETITRLSQDSDSNPFWHPDGQAVVVTSTTAPLGLWLKQLNGTQRSLMEMELGRIILRNGSWHPNGRQFAITRQSGNEHGILLVSVDEEIAVEPLIVGTSRYHSPRFSPNGNWLAYVSDKSGESQIYIRSFPGGEEFIVSNGRFATEPLWSSDGEELYFRLIKEGQNGIDANIAAVNITETDRGIQISQATELFPLSTRSQAGEIEEYSVGYNANQRYSLLPDGRFLMIKGPSGGYQNEIILVQNWFEEINRLAPPLPQ